eukprot:2070030-Pyramimonas_sp.AAC.1
MEFLAPRASGFRRSPGWASPLGARQPLPMPRRVLVRWVGSSVPARGQPVWGGGGASAFRAGG